MITIAELGALMDATGIRIVSVMGGLEVRDGLGVVAVTQTLESAIGVAVKIAGNKSRVPA